MGGAEDKQFYIQWVGKSSGGFRGGKGGANAPPFWRRVMYFGVHNYNCTSPSNDYAGVACSNNQA